jgi:flagellar hook assembly protein FlgD
VASDLRGYPNPFNSNTTVSFTLGEPSPVRLAVYDAAGRHVATLVDGECLVGDHSVEWDGTVGGGRRASAGVYFARLEAAGGTAVVKLVLRR